MSKTPHHHRPAQKSLKRKIEYPSSLQSREGWSRYFDMRRPKQPHLHQIEPTNHCPYSCVMCPRKGMVRETGFLEMSLYEKVIDEVATFEEPVRSKEIELFHFGEALLHPKLCEMVAYGASRDLKMVLSVNAPELTPEVADRIIENKPAKIIISLDGFDDESYRAARGKNANFGRARENLLVLAERYGGDQTEVDIVIQMIQLHANIDRAEAVKTEWEEKGLRVDLRSFFPWNDPKMADLGPYEKYPPGMPCPFIWQYMVVHWNGDVVPCCRDYDAVNVMGNANDQSLEEIWNSDKYEAFRQQHRTGNYGKNKLCEDCMSLYYTEPGS